MQKTAIITGGGTGLGQALAHNLASRDFKVIIIGRRFEKLKITQSFSKENIIPICADVSEIQGRNKIFQKVAGLGFKIDYLIHNAAVVTPIMPLEKITLKKFQETLAINLEAPIFLTKLLLPLLNLPARILHISSDCSYYPLANWVPYCVSKAGLNMAYQCLKKEFEDRPIHIGSIDPCMMDTPMQDYIRRPEVVFPEKYTDDELYEQNLLYMPEFSAKFIVKILLELSDNNFSEKEWRVGDTLP
jgi:benzil reductase ((S)-benzoin forming)